MGFMWEMTIDDYIKICEICIELKMKPGDSMEEVTIAYMKLKGVKPTMTDLTKDELIEQLAKGKKILDIQTDEDGDSDYRFIEGENNDE